MIKKSGSEILQVKKRMQEVKIKKMSFLDELKKERKEIKVEKIGEEEFEKRVKELKELKEMLCDIDFAILSETHNLITGEFSFPDTYSGEGQKGKDIGCLSGFGWKSDYIGKQLEFSKRLIIFFSNGNFVKMPDIWNGEKKQEEITPEELSMKVSLLVTKNGWKVDGYESLKTYIEKFLALGVIIEGTGKRLENPDENFGAYIATMKPEEILQRKMEIIERLNPRLKEI